MTTIHFQSLMGEPLRPALALTRARRRLATIAKQQDAKVGRWLCHVVRAGDPMMRSDLTVKAPSRYRHCLVGPNDTVIFTRIPRGGGGGGGKGAGGILMGVAALALLVVAPWAGGFLFGAAGLLGTSAIGAAVVQGAFAIGASLLMGAAQRSKSNRDRREVNSITGGGNVPRPGERKPVIFGRAWTQPPLSQRDVIEYTGDDMLLTKRMTLALGRHQINSIRVGEATFWTQAGGIQAPFDGNDAGGRALSAIEFLYEQPSAILPGDVISSGSVAGINLPRPSGNPTWTPWFTSNPSNTTISRIQLDMQWPSGISRTNSKGEPRTQPAGIRYEIRPINNAGAVIGAVQTVLVETGFLNTQKPWRVTRYVDVAPGRYEVRAQNQYDEAERTTTDASWDGLRAHVPDARVRAETTEIVMRIKAAKGLSITAFSDIWVDSTSILPVWNGTAWVEMAEQRATWAYAHMVRASWGLRKTDAVLDLAKILEVNGRVTTLNQFNGQMPDVSSWWEASNLVLGAIRSDPILVGGTFSFVRDEPPPFGTPPRHVFTRRQMVEDSSQAVYTMAGESGSGDIIVEFNLDGDPRTPREVRASVGAETQTPKRVRPEGITDSEQAARWAKWAAAVSVFRAATRSFKAEWDGRLVLPGDRVSCDIWWLDKALVAAVSGVAGNVLTLDVDHGLQIGGAYTLYASLRDRNGTEWALIRCRGAAGRGVELEPSDLATAQSTSGRTLGQVIARDDQFGTTIKIGTLIEQQRTYVAKSSVPSSPDVTDIEVVRDDARVWDFINEAYTPPQPVNPGFTVPIVPVMSGFAARCILFETGIAAAWSVAPALGAVAYQVELAYDAKTWEPVHNGPQASGVYRVRQSDVPVTMRARAVGATGIPSEWAIATFATVAPVLDGGTITPGTVNIGQMAADTWQRINGVFPPLITRQKIDFQQLLQDVSTVKAERTTLSIAVRSGDSVATINDTVAVLASDVGAATQRLSIAESTVASNSNALVATAARLTTEENTRAAADIAATQRITTAESSIGTLGSRITTVEGTQTTQAGTLATVETNLTSTTALATLAKSTADSAVATGSSNSASITTLQQTQTNQAGSISTLQTNVTAAQGTANTGVANAATAQTAATNAANAAAALKTSVDAVFNGDVAAALINMGAVAGAGGTASLIEFLARQTTGGTPRSAGLRIGANAATGFVEIVANQFFISDPGWNSGVQGNLLTWNGSRFVFGPPVLFNSNVTFAAGIVTTGALAGNAITEQFSASSSSNSVGANNVWTNSGLDIAVTVAAGDKVSIVVDFTATVASTNSSPNTVHFRVNRVTSGVRTQIGFEQLIAVPGYDPVAQRAFEDLPASGSHTYEVQHRFINTGSVTGGINTTGSRLHTLRILKR